TPFIKCSFRTSSPVDGDMRQHVKALDRVVRSEPGDFQRSFRKALVRNACASSYGSRSPLVRAVVPSRLKGVRRRRGAGARDGGPGCAPGRGTGAPVKPSWTTAQVPA